MGTNKRRNEQQRADDFEALVGRFLKAVGYTQIEDEPEIGTKRADFLIATGEGSFFVEAKSPHLMKDTMFDPNHCDRVMQYEKEVTRYVKAQFKQLYENCIMTGSWEGFLGRGIAEEDIEDIGKRLEPLKHWVGREKELPTERDLGKWYAWLDHYESVKTYIENHPELEPEAVRLFKSQCPFYDEIPSYPYGRFSVPTPAPKEGKPQEWHCTWRLVRRDRYHPATRGFTFFGGGGPAGSRHRIEPTIEKAIKEYKMKLKLAEGQFPELPDIPLVLFVDGRTADHNIDKDDLDLAFARGVWKGGPSEKYPKVPLGVVVLGTPMRGGSQGGCDMVGDFIHNPYWGTSFPPVISPLLGTRKLRNWSVVKTLQQIEKGPE